MGLCLYFVMFEMWHMTHLIEGRLDDSDKPKNEKDHNRSIHLLPMTFQQKGVFYFHLIMVQNFYWDPVLSSWPLQVRKRDYHQLILAAFPNFFKGWADFSLWFGLDLIKLFVFPAFVAVLFIIKSQDFLQKILRFFLYSCFSKILMIKHSCRRSNVFEDARVWFLLKPNQISPNFTIFSKFYQIYPNFTQFIQINPNFSQILPKFAQIGLNLPKFSKIFARWCCGCIPCVPYRFYALTVIKWFHYVNL